MVVDNDRLVKIFDAVADRIAQANEYGTLHGFLSAIGLQGLLGEYDEVDMGECDEAYGHILVLGDCGSNKNKLYGIANDLGYTRKRFEFVEYDELPQFNTGKLQYSGHYAAVMCGPVPHKAGGIGDASSILETLRHPENGYPPLAELRTSGGKGELRITGNSFREGLENLARLGAIRPNREYR
jgi:hypothetical protein